MRVAKSKIVLCRRNFAKGAVSETTAGSNANWMGASKLCSVFGSQRNIDVGESSNVRALTCVGDDLSRCARLSDEVTAGTSDDDALTGGAA